MKTAKRNAKKIRKAVRDNLQVGYNEVFANVNRMSFAQRWKIGTAVILKRPLEFKSR
jgi:hypothetical protein